MQIPSAVYEIAGGLKPGSLQCKSLGDANNDPLFSKHPGDILRTILGTSRSNLELISEPSWGHRAAIWKPFGAVSGTAPSPNMVSPLCSSGQVGQGGQGGQGSQGGQGGQGGRGGQGRPGRPKRPVPARAANATSAARRSEFQTPSQNKQV